MEIHTGVGGWHGHRGSDYNKLVEEEFDKVGGVDSITPAGIEEVFDKLCDYFGFRDGM